MSFHPTALFAPGGLAGNVTRMGGVRGFLNRLAFDAAGENPLHRIAAETNAEPRPAVTAPPPVVKPSQGHTDPFTGTPGGEGVTT